MRAIAGQYLAAGLGHKNVIFYSHAEFAGDVYARLNRNDLAGFEGTGGTDFQERQFVDFQAEAVSCAVAVNG